MAYMSGSKAARNVESITNRATCGGSAKKAGLAPRVGWYLSSWGGQLPRAPQTMPLICVPNYTVQTQKVGYRATIGGNMG